MDALLLLLTYRVLKDLKIVRNLLNLFATINVGLEHIIVHLNAPPPFGRDACYAEIDNTRKMLEEIAG